jgi:hypothetical protein
VNRWIVSILVLGTFLAIAPTVEADKDNWEKIDSVRLGDGDDEEKSRIGMEDGWYRWIKFNAKGGKVDLEQAVVHFRNGDNEKFSRLGTLSDGEETRPLNIGTLKKRFIQKIEFEYEIKSDDKGVTLETYGRTGD